MADSNIKTIRPACDSDFDRIMEIYAHARAFMAEHGNPTQWGPTNWPPTQLIHDDISAGKCYVCIEGGRIVGVFYFNCGKDIEPAYNSIEEGTWLDDSPYGVIHRIASDGTTSGVGNCCIQWALRQCEHMRMDTHGDNIIMIGLLKKIGFRRCGIIHVEEDDYPRFAYEILSPSGVKRPS